MTAAARSETRTKLFFALSAAIASAPQAEQAALAAALENFATERGERTYRKISHANPVTREMFEVIEESCDARLFFS